MLTAVNDLAGIHIEMGPSHTVLKVPNSVWNSIFHPMNESLRYVLSSIPCSLLFLIKAHNFHILIFWMIQLNNIDDTIVVYIGNF